MRPIQFASFVLFPILMLVIVSLHGCGGEAVVNPPAKVVFVERKPTILILYSSMVNCASCADRNQRLSSLLSGLSKAAIDSLSVSLFLTEGPKYPMPPTYDDAEAYYKGFIKGIPFSDKGWVNYKNMLPGENLITPTALIYDNGAKLLGKHMNYSPEIVFSEIKARVGQ